MICVLVDAVEKDLLHAKKICESNEFVKEVITFSFVNDAFLFLSQNPADVLFLNLETPYAYEAILSGKTFGPSTFVILNSKNKSLCERFLNLKSSKIKFMYKLFVEERVCKLLVKCHKTLSLDQFV